MLSLASPNARSEARSSPQTLTPTPMSASQFNSLYTPSTTVLSSNYDFHEHAQRGLRRVTGLQRHGCTAAGTYAYAYQFGVNNAMDTSIQQATSVNSASMLFNATPTGTDFTHTGSNTYAYVVTNGQVGRHQCSPGRPRAASSRLPSSIAWLPELDHRFTDVSVL